MKKLSCLLIDDERLARQELRLLLKEFPDFEVIGEAANADEGIEQIRALTPDLLFLDIQMPEKTGFELLEELDHTPKIIFTTAYDQYALRAFEVNALDYLLKPIRSERLTQTLQKIATEFKANASTQPLPNHRQVFIKDGDHCHFVKLSEVFLIQSVGNYAQLHFGTQKALIKRSLNLLEQKLDQNLFFRANRKEIINFTYIDQIIPMFKGSLRIQLQSGQQVEVSERQSARFREQMSL